MKRMRLGNTNSAVRSCAKVINAYAEGEVSEEKFRSLMYSFSVYLPSLRQSEELQLLRIKIADLEARINRAGGQA